ncbi:MAG: SRPBCC family protein [Leptolyngbyaceae bacterium]|nr:SRPBCC family protein [Leptolyngbyaceae bacterium]
MTISSAHSHPNPQTAVKLESLEELISPLSAKEQTALRDRHPVVVPVSRRFISRILVAAPSSIVWQTLTDYGNFSQFLPTVVSSRVVESEGDRHIVEQVDTRTILLAPVRTTVRTENIEIPQKRINFRLVGGDLKKFDGHWQLYPVATREAPDMQQTLLVQSAEVDAGSVFFEGIVHTLIPDSLRANVKAIRDEAERRI